MFLFPVLFLFFHFAETHFATAKNFSLSLS